MRISGDIFVAHATRNQDFWRYFVAHATKIRIFGDIFVAHATKNKDFGDIFVVHATKSQDFGDIFVAHAVIHLTCVQNVSLPWGVARSRLIPEYRIRASFTKSSRNISSCQIYFRLSHARRMYLVAMQ
jgi:hypothetical protein